MPGSPAHLIRRFFDVARARPLSSAERAEVAGRLTDDLTTLFFDQPGCDQRHGYQAALSVVADGVTDNGVIVAALMHDVGKRHSRLGLIGRSVASVMILMRLSRLPDRVAAYRDHGVTGARDLGRAGAPALAIDFALHHHGRRPPSIAPDTWKVLVKADEPAKTSGLRQSRITSADT
ncbi:MAG: hypothetical protein WAL25_02775 [Acidimicrobiia bacterium]